MSGDKCTVSFVVKSAFNTFQPLKIKTDNNYINKCEGTNT